MNPKKTFVPIIDNGSGAGKMSWIMCMLQNFAGHNIQISRVSDSHADRQCNRACSMFLQTDCDDMLIIDIDVTFRPQDITRILSYDVGLVYGIYPKKEDVTRPCFDTYGFDAVPRHDGLVEVRWAGRGFLRVKREVLEAMKEENGGPAEAYHNHGETEWDFFSAGCISGEQSCMPEGKREWVSEDIAFSLRAKKLGFPVLVDPCIPLGHEGSKLYLFGTTQVARVDTNITSWREIHGWFDYEPLYRRLVNEIPDGGKFVEVGVWMGKSICAFAEFAKEAGKQIGITAVDTFCGEAANQEQQNILDAHNGSVEKAFRGHLEALGLTDKVNVVAKSSEWAATDFRNYDFDAVFIDGDHRCEQVKWDIYTWGLNVKPSGIIAGHDIDEEGVRKAVTEAFGNNFEVVGRCWYHCKP